MRTYREFQEAQQISYSPFKKAVSFVFRAMEQMQEVARLDPRMEEDFKMVQRLYDQLLAKFKTTPEYDQIMNRDLTA